jgi:hypothetical protein
VDEGLAETRNAGGHAMNMVAKLKYLIREEGYDYRDGRKSFDDSPVLLIYSQNDINTSVGWIHMRRGRIDDWSVGTASYLVRLADETIEGPADPPPY